jgi:hypothetical protein
MVKNLPNLTVLFGATRKNLLLLRPGVLFRRAHQRA